MRDLLEGEAPLVEAEHADTPKAFRLSDSKEEHFDGSLLETVKVLTAPVAKTNVREASSKNP